MKLQGSLACLLLALYLGSGEAGPLLSGGASAETGIAEAIGQGVGEAASSGIREAMGPGMGDAFGHRVSEATVSYTHLTLPTTGSLCRSRWSPYH